eukprot:g10085.t1
MKHNGSRAAQEIEVEVTSRTSNENGSRSRKRGNTVILAKDIKLSFVTHVGWDGTLVLFFMFCMAGMAFYLLYPYTGWFTNFEREYLSVFMILSMMYLSATVYLVLRWKHIALDYTQRATGGRNPHDNISALKQFYRETCINGSYYLWKLYLIELLESFNQLNNLIQVYLCSMPVEFSSCTCLILAVDSCFRAYEVSQDNSPSRRDRQIKIDAVVDTISMVAPLANTSIPLWEKRCMVKTPFCGKLFEPTCNCAVLNVQGHNWSSLPKGVLDMSALKKMQINHGALRELDEDFDKHFAKLVFLDLSYNRLHIIPTSLGNLDLNAIKLANNQLSSIPDSVWGLNQLFWLELDNNNISQISSTIANAKSLTRILSSNNTLVEVPHELFNLNVVSLFLDGNNLTSIPEHIGKLKTLRNLKLQNNNISHVVGSMQNLVNLDNIDLRNNRIESIPEDAVGGWISLNYIYLDHNPICSNGWLDTAPTVKEIVKQSNNRGAGCRAQCSLYCQDRLLKMKLEMCLRECNSKSCSYDGGRCSV